MVFCPSVLLYVAETSTERRVALTPLEAFLSLHGGILLGAYALALLFNVRYNYQPLHWIQFKLKRTRI